MNSNSKKKLSISNPRVIKRNPKKYSEFFVLISSSKQNHNTDCNKN